MFEFLLKLMEKKSLDKYIGCLTEMTFCRTFKNYVNISHSYLSLESLSKIT